MLIAPIALTSEKLTRQELSADRGNALRFGSCALGKRAVYLGGWLRSRARYIPLSRVDRVYKRLAVSKGFYEGKVYGTLCYLVVCYEGREAVCRFTHEEELNTMLETFRKKTRISVGKK